MIGRLAGTLLEKNPPQILLDVQGVAYEVDVPMSTFYNLPNIGDRLTLFTHLVVREDAHLLFGFGSENERRAFRQLIRISGVGARIALAVLSGLSVAELAQAVTMQDSGRLTKIPGIGKKTAERLLLELKDKLGADVTNVSVHFGGMLVGLRSIPLGARDITNDIAAAFAVQRRDAERMKCFYGSAMTSPRDNHEMIEATQIGAEQGAEPMKITRAQLMMVIRQRIEELTNEIDAALKGLGFSGPVGRQVVLTGGGAELKNIADYMQGVLGRAVRVGRPRTITGLPEAHSGPAFSTLVGLVMLAGSGSGDIRDLAMGTGRERKPATGMVGRLLNALRQAY